MSDKNILLRYDASFLYCYKFMCSAFFLVFDDAPMLRYSEMEMLLAEITQGKVCRRKYCCMSVLCFIVADCAISEGMNGAEKP